jgi:hypothetical protein
VLARAGLGGRLRRGLRLHVARHPEDVGRTVEDFNSILAEIVRSFIPQR